MAADETASQQTARYGRDDVIGTKYRLIRLIDEGGMGMVWAAHNVDLDVHVALKLIRSELANTDAAERLLHEARLLARLDHPAIVRVHDCGRTDHGDPWIALELLNGECLADALYRAGRFSAIRAIELMLPVVDAVRAAHGRGIVHRDLKPDNIYLAKNGGREQPKVLDFGIALADRATGRLTTNGTVLGSPAYMSPEQARGQKDVDAASDVWALCVVLYELVTGRAPFEADNYHAVLRSIIETTPPSITELGAGDQLLASIIERGLAKDKARRWASAEELGVALAQWLFGQGVTQDAARVSLHGTWLPRHDSEPPVSIPPVILPGSEPPPRRGSTPRDAKTQVAAAIEPVIRELDDTKGEDGTRRSTSGLAVTARTPAPVRRRVALLAAAAALVVGGALVAGARLAQPPTARAVDTSAAVPATERVTPPREQPAPRTPPVGAQTAEADEPVADGGAATVEVAPTDVPVPQRTRPQRAAAPRSGKRPYRPGGI